MEDEIVRLKSELKLLEDEVKKYRRMDTWNVTCEGCADMLDKSLESYFHEDNLELRSELIEWKRRFEWVVERGQGVAKGGSGLIGDRRWYAWKYEPDGDMADGFRVAGEWLGETAEETVDKAIAAEEENER